MRAVFCLVAWLAFSAALAAAQAPPPRPTKYFNDYAGMVSAQTAARLERALEDYEKETSSQILVAIFPKLPENSALEPIMMVGVGGMVGVVLVAMYLPIFSMAGNIKAD